MLLVLDLDQTLIDHNEDKKPICKPDFVLFGFNVYIRPFLEEFLDFIFNHFDYVAIWSSAKQIWIDGIIKNIPALKMRSFLFIWSREKSTWLGKLPKSTKPLKKIWHQKKYKQLGIGRENTLIMDDLPINYRLNYGNAISIKSYDFSDDDIIRNHGFWYGFYALEKQIEILKYILKNSIKDVRLIKKE